MDWKSTDGRKKQIALVVYVDDLLARVNLSDAETKQRYETFVNSMQAKFAVEDRGHCDHMLGYKIDYDKKRGILKMTQKAVYWHCLLERAMRTRQENPHRRHQESSRTSLGVLAPTPQKEKMKSRR
jgi:hypothetical protein